MKHVYNIISISNFYHIATCFEYIHLYCYQYIACVCVCAAYQQSLFMNNIRDWINQFKIAFSFVFLPSIFDAVHHFFLDFFYKYTCSSNRIRFGSHGSTLHLITLSKILNEILHLVACRSYAIHFSIFSNTQPHTPLHILCMNRRMFHFDYNTLVDAYFLSHLNPIHVRMQHLSHHRFLSEKWM